MVVKSDGRKAVKMVVDLVVRKDGRWAAWKVLSSAVLLGSLKAAKKDDEMVGDSADGMAEP